MRYFSAMSRSAHLWPVPHTQSARARTTALETVTQGLARATSHRVLSPPKGSTPRYSIPFFQNIAQKISIKDIQLECT